MLIRADARSIPLRDGFVQTCVTSPPYWGLRDYGSPNQIGLEATPEAYIGHLVEVFAEVRRVLKADGTAWLNLGDSYAANGKGGRDEEVRSRGKRQPRGSSRWGGGNVEVRGLKCKDLIGIPWRVAFALQADGWYLRQDIIWAKPNPMPESVADRCTKSHEYLFLLSKSERYHYDADAIKEPATCAAPGNVTNKYQTLYEDGDDMHRTKANLCAIGPKDNRNRRSVWTIPTMPYAGAHFATMPEKLVEPCILAGSHFGDLVFDPFSGSGTVLAVAERLGRRGVGTDLNPAYHELAKKRTAQRGLRFEEASA